MRVFKAFATLAAALLIAAPASADIWWETDDGTLYWDENVGTFSVFKFFFGNTNQINDNYAFFVDGAGGFNYTDQLGGRTFGGQWYVYGTFADSSGGCGLMAVDPKGQSAQYWGSLTITFEPGGEYFVAQIKHCATQDVIDVTTGTPGQ